MIDPIIILIIIIVAILSFFIGKIITDNKWKNKLDDIRKDAIKRSRAVLGGQFSEQLAPYLPDFPFSPTEARFIGKPIDLLIFKGMDKKEIQEIIFVEIKSGNSRLSKQEQNLRDAIKNKNISWVEYRIPKDITKKP